MVGEVQGELDAVARLERQALCADSGASSLWLLPHGLVKEDGRVKVAIATMVNASERSMVMNRLKIQKEANFANPCHLLYKFLACMMGAFGCTFIFLWETLLNSQLQT